MKMSCLIIYSFVRSRILKQRIRKMRTAKECDLQNSRFFFLNPSRKAADRGFSRGKVQLLPSFYIQRNNFFPDKLPSSFFHPRSFLRCIQFILNLAQLNVTGTT